MKVLEQGFSVITGGKHDSSPEIFFKMNDSIQSKVFSGPSLVFICNILFTLSYPAFSKQFTA